MKTAVLMDGNNLAYRAFATMQLTNQKNEDVSAVWGSLNMIRSTLDKLKPDFFCVAWDYGGSTYRYGLYPDYKAHRKQAQEATEEDKKSRAEFYRQLGILYSELPHFGVKQMRSQGVEADDLLAYWVKAYGHNYDRVILVTTDKDMYQLVSENVMCFNPITSKYTHLKNFVEVTGVELHQYVDYKVLLGDSSDNIPGIRGVGEVTGAKLLTQYGSIAEMLTEANKWKMGVSAVGSRIIAGAETLALNKQLMDLSISINLIPDLEDLVSEELSRMVNFSTKATRQFCIDNSFNSFLERAGFFTPFHELSTKG
jgi:DNA polymerase-1